jgi:carbonyl reductase 1
MNIGPITTAAEYIQATYGRCDVLINNAAVCYNDPTLYGTVSHTPFAQQAETTIATNFFGTLALTRAMLPLLLQEGSINSSISSNTTTPSRIINIASSAGRLSIIPSNEKKKTLSSESLTFGDLEALMKDFVIAAKEGRHSSEGWPNTGYGVSKVGIIAMTKILARQHCGNNSDNDSSSVRRIMVNSVDPGYCATDQNNKQGVIPAERGAVTPYLLATLNDDVSNSDNGFTGKHWYQEREIEW